MLAPREAPQLILESFNATSFTVSWNRESCLSRNGPDRYYTVRYYETGSTQILESANVNVDYRTFTANTLNPVTSYTIDVAYLNTITSSPRSALNITTLALPCECIFNALILFLSDINITQLNHSYLNCVTCPKICLILSDGLDNSAIDSYTDARPYIVEMWLIKMVNHLTARITLACNKLTKVILTLIKR